MKNKSTIGTVLVFFLVLLGGGGVSFYLLSTGPEITPGENTPSAKIVQTVPLRPQSHPVTVRAFGTVIAARKVSIKPQVSGQVIRQSDAVTLGGHVKEGDELVRIDPQDYELALAEVHADLEQARFEQDVENGRQVIAKREWAELEADLEMADVNPSLVLREPHLRRAEALVKKARNDIAKAELQLSRTLIRAPFNAMVVDESVEVGQLLSPSSTICELVGTDAFWIQVTVPMPTLPWVRIPTGDVPGADVDVILDTGEGDPARWRGRVIRLLSDLDPFGRMARLIVSVPDPLGLRETSRQPVPLLLGGYVEVRIEAGQIENALVIPREALREGNLVWTVSPAHRLHIHPATILWTEKDTLLIENDLGSDLELIVSGLRVALPEMTVEPQRSTAYPGLLPPPTETDGHGP